MKYLVTATRIIVGMLFIFSGLVKANDPLGLSYKMQEYFEIWHLESFHSWTLPLSILMNAFEIIAGFALLIGWRIRLFIWLLLLLIIFFTFLTGYTYVTGKPTNCGCFGDCIPITSQMSFWKDVVLTVLIGFLFWKRASIRPLLSGKSGPLAMLLVTLFSFGLQWYSLKYLPIVDCLPFKKGNNITAKMQIPSGAIRDSFAIRFIYEKDGKQHEFAPSELPADLGSYKYMSRTDKLIRKGNAEPPIKGFALSGITDTDSTSIILSQPYALLLFCEDFSVPVNKWKNSFTEISKKATSHNIPVYVVTGRQEEAMHLLSGMGQVMTCDNTAIRTAARANPTLYLLKEGTIVDKQAAPRMEIIGKKIDALPVLQKSEEVPPTQP